MKKLIALLMVCGFAFAFVACGGGQSEEASDTTESVETPAEEPMEEAPVEEPASDTTVTDTTSTEG